MAERLGIDIRTLRKWRQKPTFPHEAKTAEEVRAWADANGLGRVQAGGGGLAELKAEIMRRDIELRDLRIARERGDVIDREVVEEMLGLLAQKLDLLLRLKLEVELGPRVAGKSAADVNVEGAAMLDEIREVVNANLAKFQTDAIKETQRSDDATE